MTTLGMTEVYSARSFRWINAGHAKSLLRHISKSSTFGRIASIAATPIPSFLSLPYPGDDLFWSVFRKTDHDRELSWLSNHLC